jgi:hypothetical protein
VGRRGTGEVRSGSEPIEFGDVTIGNVQLGYEITSSAGGKDFVTNGFSVTG